MTVRAESLTVEATSYRGYLDFRVLLKSAFEAVEQVMQPDGLTRLDMRYIDEIRIPDATKPDPWGRLAGSIT
ncbi:MAG: TIGR04255 family protein, partial [Acidimicrobiales bacterium]